MRKLMIAVIVLVVIMLPLAGNAAALEPIRVFVNGQEVKMDVKPVIISGRTLVPFRALGEALGIQVEWKEATREVLAYGQTTVRLKIDSKQAVVNGQTYQLDVPARIIGNRTMIPLRFFSERLGATVDWQDQTRRIYITAAGSSYTKPAAEVLGFYAFNSYRALQKWPQSMTKVAMYWYTLGEDGKVTTMSHFPKDYQLALNFARNNNVGVEALLFSTNGTIIHNILNDPNLQAETINTTLALLAKDKYDGLNLDIETVSKNDGAAFTAFVEKLAARLHAQGYTLTLSLHAKYRDIDWAGYDYQRLGKVADKVVLMTYDEHWKGGDPGPIASKPWVEKVLKYAVQKIPAEKIIMGLGIYGYDWSADGKTATTKDLVTIQNLAAQLKKPINWDATAQAPYLAYTDANGVAHQIWFEDSQSVAAKLSLVQQYGINGIALWQIGTIPQEIWDTINQQITVVKQ